MNRISNLLILAVCLFAIFSVQASILDYSSFLESIAVEKVVVKHNLNSKQVSKDYLLVDTNVSTFLKTLESDFLLLLNNEKHPLFIETEISVFLSGEVGELPVILLKTHIDENLNGITELSIPDYKQNVPHLAGNVILNFQGLVGNLKFSKGFQSISFKCKLSKVEIRDENFEFKGYDVVFMRDIADAITESGELNIGYIKLDLGVLNISSDDLAINFDVKDSGIFTNILLASSARNLAVAGNATRDNINVKRYVISLELQHLDSEVLKTLDVKNKQIQRQNLSLEEKQIAILQEILALLPSLLYKSPRLVTNQLEFDAKQGSFSGKLDVKLVGEKSQVLDQQVLLDALQGSGFAKIQHGLLEAFLETVYSDEAKEYINSLLSHKLLIPATNDVYHADISFQDGQIKTNGYPLSTQLEALDAELEKKRKQREEEQQAEELEEKRKQREEEQRAEELEEKRKQREEEQRAEVERKLEEQESTFPGCPYYKLSELEYKREQLIDAADALFYNPLNTNIWFEFYVKRAVVDDIIKTCRNVEPFFSEANTRAQMADNQRTHRLEMNRTPILIK